MTKENARERIARRLRLTEENPDSATAHYKLGLAYTQVGKMDSAARAYRRALELDPAMCKAWVNLGGSLFLKWDFQGAVEANEKALALDPELLEAHFGLGQAQLYLKQPAEVVRCNRQVIELDPTHGAGHYFLAVGLLALGEVGPARESLAFAMRYGYQPRPEFLRELAKAEKHTHLEAAMSSKIDKNNSSSDEPNQDDLKEN